MKKRNSILALALVFALMLSMSVNCFAATDITSSGGSASTPVSLSSTDDGTSGGNPSATAMSVTIPTALPMAMAQDGVVTTASNCKIVNNSYGAVRVKSATIHAGDGWKLTAFDDKSSLAGAKVDSNQIGFALTLGSGAQLKTDSSNAATQTLLAAPTAGCYMSGVGDTANNSIAVQYAAIVTPLSSAVTDANVASVVFVIEWDTAN